MEQFREGLPPALKVSLREKDPTSGAEAGLAADTYVGAQRYGRYTKGLPQDMSTQKHDNGVSRYELGVSGERRVVEGKVERKYYRYGDIGHFKWDCPREVKPRFVGEKPQRVENPTWVLRCYSCGGKGHISTRYPAKPDLYCRLDSVRPIARIF